MSRRRKTLSLKFAALIAVVCLGLVLLMLGGGGGVQWISQAEEKGPALYDQAWFGQGWVPGAQEDRDLNFNHQRHVEKEGLECADCHEGATSEVRAGMPTMDTCADCHEETDDSTDDKAGCLLCHNLMNLPAGCSKEGCPEDKLPDIVTRIGPKPYRNVKYDETGKIPGFSHAVHADKGVPCERCHDGIAAQADMPLPTGKYMPKPQACFDCHTRELRNFNHDGHVEQQGVKCEDCHKDVAKDETFPNGRKALVPDAIPIATRQFCANCHAPVSPDCQTCHVERTFSRIDKPESHRGNWIDFHGAAARLTATEAHGQSCSTCHVQTDCTSCHNTQPPRDHTNFWRTRAHGLMAAGNRERCETCHRVDFCTACHNETPPRTHIGSWENATHCPWCHVSSGLSTPDNSCRVCHRQALHASAPHPINVGTKDCFICHNPVTGRAK